MSLSDQLYTPKNLNNKTGQKIKLIRLSKNISRKELSDACGVNVNTISNYESCTRQVSDDKLNLIANTLGVSISSLYDHKITSYVDAIHVLFELADAFDLIPDKPFTGIPPVLIAKDDTLKEAIRAWYIKRCEYNQKKISAAELKEWELSFPDQYLDEVPHGEENFINGYDNATVLRGAINQIKLVAKEQTTQISKLLDDHDIIQAKTQLDFLQRMIESIASANTP